MNKQQLIENIQSHRARLEERLEGMSAEELMARPSPKAWSVKDALAHLVYWEQYMLGNIRLALEKGEAPQWVNQIEENRLNDQIFNDNRDRPLNDIMEDWHRSQDAVIRQVEALSEEQLTDPNAFDWMNGQPLSKYIADEAFGEHYEEHLGR